MSVVRATYDTEGLKKKAATVKASSAVTAFMPIKRDGTDVLDCTAGDSCDGYSEASYAAGDVASFILPGGSGIVRAKVGTGGTATEGSWAVVGTAGVTNAAAIAGDTIQNIVGKFVDGGTAGDVVGMLPIVFTATKA